jgi:hypothetical protein
MHEQARRCRESTARIGRAAGWKRERTWPLIAPARQGILQMSDSHKERNLRPIAPTRSDQHRNYQGLTAQQVRTAMRDAGQPLTFFRTRGDSSTNSVMDTPGGAWLGRGGLLSSTGRLVPLPEPAPAVPDSPEEQPPLSP